VEVARDLAGRVGDLHVRVGEPRLGTTGQWRRTARRRDEGGSAMTTGSQLLRHRGPGLRRGHLARRVRLGAADRGGPHERLIPRAPTRTPNPPRSPGASPFEG